MDKFASASSLLKANRLLNPVLAFRPHAVRRAARSFLDHFPGKILYAVKANNRPQVIDLLLEEGVHAFDVASLTEIEQLAEYSQCELYLMNPIKPRHVITQAYRDFGVRNFSLDSLYELEKIRQATHNARDLNLFVRVSCNGDGAQIGLEGKFGVSGPEACELLLEARKYAVKLGVTFHVGSQMMAPERFSKAMQDVSQLIADAGVLPDVIDVGGGFPSLYPGLTPPPLAVYFKAIEQTFETINVVGTCELICEPGRALVAEAESLIVRVEHRKDNRLYINDGSYGCLHDAAHYGFRFPVRRVAHRKSRNCELMPFSFYGPTCDSADFMPGPFYLPRDVAEGDYIEIGQVGAYGRVLSTLFNGFGRYESIEVADDPIMSMYSGSTSRPEFEDIVAI